MAQEQTEKRVHELEEALKEAQEGLVALQTALFEQGYLKEENSSLKSTISDLHSQISDLKARAFTPTSAPEEELYLLHQAFSHLQEERDSFQKALDEKHKHVEQLEKTVQFLRDKLEDAKLERQDFEEQVLHLEQQRIAVQKSLHDAIEANPLKQKVQELEMACKVLQKERLSLKEQLLSLSRERQKYQVREERLEKLEHTLPSQVNVLKEQKQTLEQLLEEKQRDFERQKKLLCQKIEEQQQKLYSSHDLLKEMQNRVKEKEAASELVTKKVAENRLLEEKLGELSNIQKNRLDNLENKYQEEMNRSAQEIKQLKEKLSDMQARVQELEPLEDIHNQVSSLVGTLNSLIEKRNRPSKNIFAPSAYPIEESVEEEVKQEDTLPPRIEREVLREEVKVGASTSTPYQNLFLPPTSSSSYKDNLF